MAKRSIWIKRCPCGMAGCQDYHLVGLGRFVQGSGFTQTEADMICRAMEMRFPDKYKYLTEENEL